MRPGKKQVQPPGRRRLWMLLCPPLPGGGGCSPFLGSSSGALTPQLSVPGSDTFLFLPSPPSVSLSWQLPRTLGAPQRVQSHLVGCVAKLCQPAPRSKWSAAAFALPEPRLMQGDPEVRRHRRYWSPPLGWSKLLGKQLILIEPEIDFKKYWKFLSWLVLAAVPELEILVF